MCSFGSQFVPDEEYTKQGFNWVFDGIAIDQEVRTALLISYLAVRCTGDPRKEEAVFHQHLDGVRWDWPWFDEWRDCFSEAGLWPYMWRYDRYRRGPCYATAWADGDEPGQEAARRMLLHHTVGAKGAHLRHNASNRRTMERRPGRHWLYLSNIDRDILQHFFPGLEACPDTVPPFFPGDRTSVLMERLPRA